MSLRLVIADDEPALRAWLRRLLGEVAPEIEVVAEAADGNAALQAIQRLRPDAALLDIRMPGLSGLEVAARLTHPCAVVFVTAYDEFAIQAFEQAAVDYLQKPVTAERLAKSLARLQALASPNPTELLRQLAERLEAPSKGQPLRWLCVDDGDSTQLLDIDEVERFEAADKYTTVYSGERRWLIRISLRELEQQITPDIFWRVHRGTLVRVAAIRAVRRDLMGRIWLDLRGDRHPVAVSRRHAHLFRPM